MVEVPGTTRRAGARRVDPFVIVGGVVLVAMIVAALGFGRGWWGPRQAVPSTPAPASSIEPGALAAKPIIYLYPTAATDVTVTLSHPERLLAQYPAYGDGWRVRAQPDGTLTDASGRQFYALYYEAARSAPAQRTDVGFVVAGADTASFLEDALPQLGLSPREADEFIIYWLPQLQSNPWTYVRFESAGEQASEQALSVSPTPDTVIRVMMDWQRLDAPVQVAPQTLSAPARSGFTVVEWGGTQIAG